MHSDLLLIVELTVIHVNALTLDRLVTDVIHLFVLLYLLLLKPSQIVGVGSQDVLIVHRQVLLTPHLPLLLSRTTLSIFLERTLFRPFQLSRLLSHQITKENVYLNSILL